MLDDLLGRHFISLFLILLFSIRLASQHSARDKELRYFWLTVVSCFLLIVEDQAELLAYEDPSLRFWRTLFSVAGYVLRSTATVGLLFVILKPGSRGRFLWWIPCLLNMAVCSTAFFTDLAFGFDAEYRFYRGPLGFVSFAVPFFYLAVILVLTFRRYVDRRRAAERLVPIVCALLCLLSAVLDSTRGGVRLHEAILISSVFFYLILRSYDVRRDSLTYVLNRQSLYDDSEALGRDICAAASLDMNGLKIMNDRQGHHAGDRALKKIGECLQAAADPNTRCYRYGGDEFVILFFHSDENVIRNTLESILARIGEAGYSVSCGYAMREDGETPEETVIRADMRMFEHKARYYRDAQHDRRRARKETPDGYPPEKRRAIEESPQPLAIYRFSDHRVEPLVLSDGFCRLFGYPDREQAMHVLDQDMVADIHPDDRERFSGAMLRFSGGEEGLDLVYRTRTGTDSDYRVIHARGAHLHTGSDARVAHVWYMDEGTYLEGDEGSGPMMNLALNRALHAESILNATHFDALTGLPSLTWFFTLSDARKSQYRDAGKEVVMLYIDLSGMKYFNHKFGFAEGDRMLKAFAGVLLRIFGKENSCHIAADRFAAVTTADGLEDRLNRLFDETAKINGGNTLPVRIGIYPSSFGDVSASYAFDRAKMACDAIRRSDISGFKYYGKEMRDNLRRRQYIVSNIDRAIRENWIRAYYQPIVRAADETVCDEEALARWIDPAEGVLAPADFLPYLEDMGLIYKVDLFILGQVLEKLVYRRNAGLPLIPQSINLSRSDFEVCDIFEEIRSRVDAAGIPHELISVEITESVIGSNFEFMNEQVNRFRANGFPVWMDDFGTGYSSLDVLRDMRFDLIKFDMSFLRKLDEGENGKIILTELMRMAAKLNLDTVCEGVEQEAHVRFLKEIGCSRLQGFRFGMPAPWEKPPEGADAPGPGPDSN